MAHWRRTLVLCGATWMVAAVSVDALADERLHPVVVTATRTEQPLTDVVADVSIIDREVIERNAGGSVADVLAKEAGIQIMRQGGIAANTELFMRGADSRFTAVFIDGIRVDSQTTSGGVSWSALPLSQIDRIEVLRGPAGAIYGSDAVAGVIQIFTRKGEAGFHPSLMVGRGTYQTDVYEASVRGGDEQVDYSVSLANDQSKGFNVQRRINPDADGYQRDSAYGRIGWNVNSAHRLELTWLAAQNLGQYDSSSKSTTDWVAQRNLNTTGISWRGKWRPGLQSQYSASQSSDLYETRSNGVPQSFSETQIHNYLWLNELRLGIHQFTAALERREDRLENRISAPMVRDRNQNGLALSYGLRLERHIFQTNLRRDRESQFGAKNTNSLAYSYALTPGWKAHFSSGTAFRAPTLYQRYHSTYGNLDLAPETSRNQEVGVKYQQGASLFGLTAYRNRVDNLIYYDAAQRKYLSTARAKIEGVTASAQTSWSRYTARASWDALNPRDEQTGLELKRRARHIIKTSVDANLSNWRTGLEVQLHGKRYEDDKNTIQLGGYSLVNLYATRPIDKDLSLLLRVDNLTNRFYELAANYYPPGTTVFVGLRWAPQ